MLTLISLYTERERHPLLLLKGDMLYQHASLFYHKSGRVSDLK
jgi:hypothetical protein